MSNIPRITRRFMSEIEIKANRGNYSLDVNGVPIVVYPYVFPPASSHSRSKINVPSDLDVAGKRVLDLGTGTGILAIEAVLAGAEYVEAVDISQNALACAKYNAEKNLVDRKVEVYPSNVFSNVRGRFDYILANLPILDARADDLKWHSLIDPEFKYHKRLFEQANLHLNSLGKLVCHHANLQRHSFEKLEELASKTGLKTRIIKTTRDLGYEWRLYEFSTLN